MLKLPITTKEYIARELARRTFRDFVAYMDPDFEWNWHHEIACEELEKWALGITKRLMVTMPPGHSKSQLASRLLPAWTFGKNLDERFITTSYSDDLASAMNRDVQRLMTSSEYKNVFPETRLNEKNVKTTAQDSGLRNADEFDILTSPGRKRPKGYYRSAGRGAGITGRRGSRLIVDDPFKDWEEASSKTIRDKVWNWYTTTFATRKSRNAGILVIQTRWHPDDLIGRLLKAETEAPSHLKEGWIQVKFEGIRTSKKGHPKDPRKEGEALWPWMLDLNGLLKEKLQLGTMMFSALFQQDPSSPEGTIVKRDQFKFWKELPAKFDILIQAWDLSFKGKASSDPVAGGVFGRKDGNFYLIDSVHKKMGFVETRSSIKTFSAKHPKAFKKLIEDKANGSAIIDDLKDLIPGIIPFDPGSSPKETRFTAVSPAIESGNYYVPDPSLPGMSWVHDYIEELCSFPNGENDDWVDMTSMALLELRGKGSDFLKKLTRT